MQLQQSIMAGSTCEAEYMAASEATHEAIWMREFITDLGVIPNASGPMTLFCDNTGAIALAKEPRFHRKTRHIKRRFNSIRESVQNGDIEICKVHTVRTPTQCHIDLACNISYHFAASHTVSPRVSPYLCTGPFASFGTRI